jgi:hypothetical protein
MPALVANYQKKVLTTRIQKFYSVFSQALNAKFAEDGDLDDSMLTEINNPDMAEEFFNVNLKPYMQTIGSKKLTKGIVVGFPDGSGMYLRKFQPTAAGQRNIQHTHVQWCVDYKKCVNIDESKAMEKVADGKDIFAFWINVNKNIIPSSSAAQTREQMLQLCKTTPGYCVLLIYNDGWEIRDDYPW